MKMATKLLVLCAMGVSIPVSAMAQGSNQFKDGDWYNPQPTVVQQASPQERNEFREGDFYAPERTTVPHLSRREANLMRHGDFYAPEAGE